MAKAQRGRRGRLSSLELLPEEASSDVQWAYQEVMARRMPQLKIVAGLNKRLADRGLAARISKSAFGRKALWVIGHGDALVKAREIAAIMAEKLDDVPEGDVGLLLGEVIKSIVFDIVSDGQLNDNVSMNMAVQASVALQKLEDARRISVGNRSKIAKTFAAKASEAVEAAGTERGLSREQIDTIKTKVLGVKIGSRE
jgi:Protein of unknown function (DUF3486)